MCRSSRPDVFCKKGVIRNFANFIGKHQGSFLPGYQNLAQVFPCEFCKISKNTFFHGRPLVAVSVFPRCYEANSLISHILLIYTLLKSFLRIYIETWNLSFCFQHYLVISKSVIDKVLLQYLEFLFIIYELNTVVSIHSNVFYPSTLTSKMLYVNFFRARFVTICLFCKFFIH